MVLCVPYVGFVLMLYNIIVFSFGMKCLQKYFDLTYICDS